MDCAFGFFITACVVISLAILSYIILPKLVSVNAYPAIGTILWRTGRGKIIFLKKKSRHASSSFLQAFYRFHQEKKQKDPALREEKKLKLLKNGRNLFAFESIWFIWKRGIHGFESNTECFELALGDNSGRMSTSEEVRQNPSLWSIFKKVKHSELKC